MNTTEWTEHTTQTLKMRMDEMSDDIIISVPLNEEEEKSHEVRTRKRLNSYGERAAALMR